MDRVKQIVNANRVYRLGYTGRGIRIALLDTGVYMHQDVRENIIFFSDYVNGRQNCYDDNGHGTHIAGIMCGKVSGMAPNAEVLVFKILGKNGDGRTQSAVHALDWLIENCKEYNIRILNFSMGYVPNADAKLQLLLMEKLEELWDLGVIVITAAGNNGPEENSVTVPGISRKVITVGSSDDWDSQISKGKGYGGRGPTSCCIVKPEILAPGTSILSLSNYDNDYIRKSGTSMSAPVVSGAMALALEKRPQTTPVEMKLMLYDSVKSISEKNCAWGILDVDKLIEML